MQHITQIIQDSVVGDVGKIDAALSRAIGIADLTQVRVAVAYASLEGVRRFLKRASVKPKFASCPKRWLISLDYGQTDPGALDVLATLACSHVRVPNARVVLSRLLVPAVAFHPKTYIFGDAPAVGSKGRAASFITSANLTYGALVANSEHGVLRAVIDPAEGDEDAVDDHVNLRQWFDKAWKRAEPWTARMAKRYEALRAGREALHDGETVVQQLLGDGGNAVSERDGAMWSTARYFWIETGRLYKNRGEGQAGNQVDCTRGTRAFFGFRITRVPRNTVLGEISIECQGYQPQSRSVRFGNNEMDKVNLPVPGVFGPDSYDNSWLRFERIAPRRFRLLVGSVAQAARWDRLSRAQDMRYQLAGGRGYGFYS